MDKTHINISVNIPARRVILKADPQHIADIHSIVESCDNIAIVRTLDPEIAVVELIATPDTFDEAMEISRAIENLLGAEIVHPGS